MNIVYMTMGKSLPPALSVFRAPTPRKNQTRSNILYWLHLSVKANVTTTATASASLAAKVEVILTAVLNFLDEPEI